VHIDRLPLQPDFGEAGQRQCRADGLWLAEAQGVAVAVDAGEGLAQFGKGLRPERAQRQLPPGRRTRRASANTLPLSHHCTVRFDHQVEKLSSLQGSASMSAARQCIGSAARDGEHACREVDRGDVRARPACA
jgi:hypothetical protein